MKSVLLVLGGILTATIIAAGIWAWTPDRDFSGRLMSRTMLGRSLKLLHEVGAIGTLGSFGACIVLLATAPTNSPVAFAAAMQGISSISSWLLVPSLAIVLISGLLAIAANEAYMSAAWAWVKALLGIGTFEGTLLTVGSSARHATDLSALAVSGRGDPAQLAQVLRTEWGGLWILVALALTNIVLAVWRPRLYPRTASVRRPTCGR